MSGAVGAICRHLSVDSNTDKRVLGGDGRYLNISFRGWPEFIRSFLFIGGLTDFDDEEGASGSEASVKYFGFVSQMNVEYREASPNIARGKGCCGMMVPAGSDSPGRMCIGMELAISFNVADKLKMGRGEKDVTSWPFRRYQGVISVVNLLK